MYYSPIRFLIRVIHCLSCDLIRLQQQKECYGKLKVRFKAKKWSTQKVVVIFGTPQVQENTYQF
jgi:hypothetical protein